MTEKLSFIIEPLYNLLNWIHNMGPTWAVSIILLTIIVRIILIPLTVKQYTSMRAMQKLQPKIKELQARFKGDKQKLNEEMMKFYSENKVNPFGSCLPLLIQMPVFMSLYFMLDLHKDDFAGSSFLWIGDITQKSQALVIIYMVTQLFSSLLLTATVDKSQKIIMILMPLGIGVFFLFGNFPAGVLIYWVTTNLWTIGQQLVVKQIIQVRENKEEVALAASGATITAELPKAKKAGGKGGSKSKKKQR